MIALFSLLVRNMKRRWEQLSPTVWLLSQRWWPCCSIVKLITSPIQVRWRWTLYQSFRSRWDLQLCSWWPFHLKSSMVPKISLKCHIFKFNFLNYPSNLIWKKDQHQSCRSRWELQLGRWPLCHLKSFAVHKSSSHNLKLKIFKRSWMEKRQNPKL
jgi:hypothetical protein